ncbi:MAG: hypothetical protein QOC58_838, partial [Mycobacterium sp.]|nr:hypothetical protein [Mycobacterium sp.]
MAPALTRCDGRAFGRRGLVDFAVSGVDGGVEVLGIGNMGEKFAQVGALVGGQS